MNKFFLFLFLIIITISCSDKRLIRKSIVNKEVAVDWYYYSYISDTSKDFIEIIKGDSSICVFKSKHIVQDINFSNDTLIITHLPFTESNHRDKIEKVFGHEIIYKEISSHDAYLKYKATKDNPPLPQE